MQKTDDYKDILDGFQNEGRLRRIPDEWNGIDLSSNDYMGLMQRMVSSGNSGVSHIDVADMSSSASRLLSSHQNCFKSLENRLGDLYGKEVVLFNSGYHANVGCMQALAIPGTMIVSDKMVHASIIDGIRLTKTNNARFRHNDIQNLQTILNKAQVDDSIKRVWVVTESVFSMDGDIAPLKELVSLKSKYSKMMLYVDEAHAFGVRGDRGLGVSEELNIIDDVDIIAGTFGKAGASVGAYIATSPILKEYLVNTARSLIFSTALPPANILWTASMLEILIRMKSEREHLHRMSRKFADELARIVIEKGMTMAIEPLNKCSHIVPLIVGDAEKAVKLSLKLQERGIKTLAIRRPTVPADTERLRISLNASLTDEDIDYILSVINQSL